jgi:hypothetical protein
MTPEQLNQELTELVRRARKFLAEFEAESRDAEQPEAPVVPFDARLYAIQQAALAEAS